MAYLPVDTVDDLEVMALISSQDMLMRLRPLATSASVKKNIHNGLIKIQVRIIEATQAPDETRDGKVAHLQSLLIPDVISAYHENFEGERCLLVVLDVPNTVLLSPDDLQQIEWEANGETIVYCTLNSPVGQRLLTGQSLE